MKQALLSLNRSLAVCGFLLFGGSASVAQSRPSLEAYVGPAFLMSPREIFTKGGPFIQAVLPAFRLRTVWNHSSRLSFTAHTQFSTLTEWTGGLTSGHHWETNGVLLEAGGGLRYADFWNLGPYLTPFVSVDASAGYGAAIHAPRPRRIGAALGAEIGLQALVTARSGPSVTLGIHGQLFPFFSPYTEPVFGINNQLIGYQRHESRGFTNSLLVGWFWQLPAPRQRWHTPRYSEAAEPEDE